MLPDTQPRQYSAAYSRHLGRRERELFSPRRLCAPTHALTWASMASEPRRPERVGEMVLRELSLMLLRDLKDPRLRGITLTGVKMPYALRPGRVFFSHLEG